ncbi:hypothetical protein NPIL_35421 [Nephila pilipes]|uniref:Uncharacterized protein n=1 Tax=Nephila pilipes TaxID=299642 RepID=A0A8X6UEP7_NEPPI|nr:hypothetical protein NPIL_35421 [Nephila pilipes]
MKLIFVVTFLKVDIPETVSSARCLLIMTFRVRNPFQNPNRDRVLSFRTPGAVGISWAKGLLQRVGSGRGNLFPSLVELSQMYPELSESRLAKITPTPIERCDNPARSRVS